MLLALVSMIVEEPSIKEQMADTNPAAIATAPILKFSSRLEWTLVLRWTPSCSIRD